jgi:hypothetical protein
LPHPQSIVVSFSTVLIDFIGPPTFPILWHGHLQDNARALVITLQRGRIKEGEWGSILNEITFEGYFEGTNTNLLRGMTLMHPNQGGRGHARWLEGHDPNVL